mgnify:FL=1
MPRKTFFNLPEPKRSRLADALRTEFARHSFKDASVDRITQDAGVSKGSLYQYFDDKLDAYGFVVTQALEARLTRVAEHPAGTGFIDLLRAMITDSASYQTSDPLGWSILARAYTDDAPAVAATVQTASGQIHRWVSEAIAAGVTAGELRATLDADAAAWLIEHTLIGLGWYLMARFGISGEQLLTGHGRFDEPAVQAVVDEVVKMLIGALGVQEPRRTPP